MATPDDNDIEFIRNDLRDRGVSLPEVEDELIDHIVSAVENEMKKGTDFNSSYREVISSFGIFGVRQVQVEKELSSENGVLKFLVYSFLYLSIVALVCGLLLTLLHKPGAAAKSLFFFSVSFGFVTTPLFVVFRFHRIKKDIALLLVIFSVMLICAGFLFRFFQIHMLAKFSVLGGAILFLLVASPLLLYRNYFA